jgi:hypothetical protein
LNSVLLDTSYLISFSDPTRLNHLTAVRYYKECVQRQVPMYLSSIVISEFQVRQAINDLPLRNFIVLPFNVDHAMACGLLIRRLQRDPADDRVRVKDDFKLIAQCECEGITHLLTEDKGILSKYLDQAQAESPSSTRSVLMRDGFDASWFENGQSALPI